MEYRSHENDGFFKDRDSEFESPIPSQKSLKRKTIFIPKKSKKMRTSQKELEILRTKSKSLQK